jgi:hypothetical protein
VTAVPAGGSRPERDVRTLSTRRRVLRRLHRRGASERCVATAIEHRDEVVYARPANADERTELADICVTRLGIKLPALVDRFDDVTDTAYSGWPDRLYLIDREGRVAYKSKPGPFGFKPEELEAALRPHLPAARP